MFLPEMEGSSNSQNLPFQMLQKVLQITNTEILEVIMYHGACQLLAIVPCESEFSNGQWNGHNGVYLAADTLHYVMVFMWICIMVMWILQNSPVDK